MTIDELLEEFEELEDWEEQCDFLIDLGFELPPFPEEQRTEQNIVHGCQSRVWLVAEPQHDGATTTLTIQADSDAMIVKGLIAILLATYSGKTPEQILETDIEALFARMGLNRHLSSTRRNGLFGMVQRIRDYARQYAA
jgi:cysteine desulfuration protein SufE